jgi:hypothetical protein
MNTKLLCLHTDNNIYTRNHIEQIIPKLSEARNAVRFKVHMSNNNTLKSFYNLNFHSIIKYRQPSLYAISLYAFSLTRFREEKPWENCTVILQSPGTVVAWLCGACTSWSHLTRISVRGSVELASPVDVERSPLIFKAMGKRSRPNCDKNCCKCKKQRKAVTLEEKLSVIHFTHFRVTRCFLGTNYRNRVIRGFAEWNNFLELLFLQ